MDNDPYRVLRGGSWTAPPSFARVAHRYGFAPGDRDDSLGVRLYRMISPVQQIAEVNNER